ncbi:resolvase [Clostridia bacterium]|nr:resolvase [Clostridia bacterium]
MYADAKAGKIDLIIIKDTSRFGRNWGQSGVYFEKIEEMGIRFISIQEGIDTVDPKCPALKMLPFYFVFNEWHSQTTSEKIKAVFHQMALDGKHHAPFAPYGYLKSPDNKHKLIIDPYSSEVVKRIYEMRLQKKSYGAIILVLNSEGILSPSAYSVQTQGNSTNKVSRNGKWRSDSLNRLFQNVVYKGDTVNEKQIVTSYKNHKQILQPQSEWIIAENTHEPIVSHEDWQKCFEMTNNLGRVRRTKENKILPFAGLLVCADCGYKLRQGNSYHTNILGEKRRYNNYNCSTYATTGKSECASRYITEKNLMEAVCADIRAKTERIICDEKSAREYYLNRKLYADSTRLKIDEKSLKQAQKRLSELERLIQAAFEKSVLSDNNDVFAEFTQKYKSEKMELSEKIKDLTAKTERHNQSVSDVETFISLMKECVNITVLDRAAAVQLIDKIVVSAKSVDPREIVIHYNFIGQI